MPCEIRFGGGPTEFGKSAIYIYQLIPKELFHMGRKANATSKTTVAFCSLTKRSGTFTG